MNPLLNENIVYLSSNIGGINGKYDKYPANTPS